MERRITPPRGFTLIELLVVMAVISVLSVGAALAWGRAGSSRVSDMALFEQSVARLQELAVAGQQIRGLVLEPRGMRLAQYSAEGWQVAEQRIGFSERAVLQVSQRALSGRFGDPQIVFMPSGRTTPFSVSFGDGRCETDGWTALSCDG